MLVDYPSLQNYILSDQEFGIQWMKEYENKSIDELYQQWIWNCKTIAMMFVLMLENSNTRWKLGITKINVIETPDYHMILSVSHKNWVTTIDPMKWLYNRTTKS